MESTSTNNLGGSAPRRWSSSDGASRAGYTGTPTDASMMAVATRIQERARKLRDEQNNLQKLKLKLENIRKEMEQEVQKNRDHRQKQLRTTIARSQVELDLFRAQDRVREQRAENDTMKLGTKAIKEQTEKIQAELQSDIENVYAPHEMEMERYRTLLECTTQKADERQEEFDKIISNIRRLKQAESELLENRKSLVSGRENLQSEDEKLLLEMNNLSDENTKVLAQRAKLRQSLREAKESQRLRDFESETSQVEQM